MTANLRDDLLIALGMIRSAERDLEPASLASAALRVAAARIQGVYDKTAPADRTSCAGETPPLSPLAGQEAQEEAAELIPFPGWSVRV